MTPIDTYPARTSEHNVARMRRLWQTELQRAGINGDAEVRYEHQPRQQRETSFGEIALDHLLGRDPIACEHAYVARLSGTPWPTEVTVNTSKGGLIFTVAYVIQVPTRVAAPLAFEYSRGQLARVKTFHGHDADRLNRDGELRNVLAASLSFRYQTGIFDQGNEIGAAGYAVEPAENGSTVTVVTTVHSNPYAVWKPATLGLAGIFAVLPRLTAALQDQRECILT